MLSGGLQRVLSTPQGVNKLEGEPPGGRHADRGGPLSGDTIDQLWQAEAAEAADDANLRHSSSTQPGETKQTHHARAWRKKTAWRRQGIWRVNQPPLVINLNR